MASKNFAIKYLKYRFFAKHKGGHGIHSPFVFDLLTRVIENFCAYYNYSKVESLRLAMLNNKNKLQVTDLGAGSTSMNSNHRRIASIARHASTQKKHGQLLFRLVNEFQPRTIIEIGTSLGITTAYLAASSSQAKVYTLEGCSNIAAVAKQNFELLELKNIDVEVGNFDTNLPKLLKQIQLVDFAYIDGNHRLKPTQNYFNQLLNKSHSNTVIILGDIHWSQEMEEAWDWVKKNPKVVLTIDLFFLGLVFFREGMQKQDFTIRF